jgi:hypothetical protein
MGSLPVRGAVLFNNFVRILTLVHPAQFTKRHGPVRPNLWSPRPAAHVLVSTAPSELSIQFWRVGSSLI